MVVVGRAVVGGAVVGGAVVGMVVVEVDERQTAEVKSDWVKGRKASLAKEVGACGS